MDTVVTLLVILLIIMVFTVLGYVSYSEMQKRLRHKYRIYHENHNPLFWVNKNRCPIGCQYVGSDGNMGKRGGEFGCPNGNQCFGPNCCKYDIDCKKCAY